MKLALRKKCLYSEKLWPLFSRIRTEYGSLRSSKLFVLIVRIINSWQSIKQFEANEMEIKVFFERKYQTCWNRTSLFDWWLEIRLFFSIFLEYRFAYVLSLISRQLVEIFFKTEEKLQNNDYDFNTSLIEK